jgi:hypothetical protein
LNYNKRFKNETIRRNAFIGRRFVGTGKFVRFVQRIERKEIR